MVEPQSWPVWATLPCAHAVCLTQGIGIPPDLIYHACQKDLVPTRVSRARAGGMGSAGDACAHMQSTDWSQPVCMTLRLLLLSFSD
jgi:hypothetical protein